MCAINSPYIILYVILKEAVFLLCKAWLEYMSIQPIPITLFVRGYRLE